ncbi:hypothetical protein ACN20G_09935 [Streptomyces sp. BI20]|uniref:hypothetical protein n=1 Tax=Streptomyces sp. BI20 TaxID=3403460 RepID=UPI003C730EA6
MLGRAVELVGPALLVYAVSTVLHLLVLAAMSRPGGLSVRDRLLSWDAQLYLDVATNGYPTALTFGENGAPQGNNTAFFPLYPLLTRGVHALTGLDAGTAALLVAHLGLLAALVAADRLLTDLYGRRAAFIGLVLLAGAQPMAVAFVMGYSESLFLALCLGTLYAARRGAWWWAGAAGMLAGLTRPAAVCVVAALGVAVLLRVVADRRAGLPWSSAARPVGGLALACVGMPAYLAWVGLRLGRMDAWFVVQEAGWGTHWDSGRAFVEFLGNTLGAEGHQDGNAGWVPVSTAVLVSACVAATALAWRRGAWPPLFAYGVFLVVITLGQSNFYHCKLRLLAPAVVFLLPVALGLARARTRTAVVVLSGGVLFGCWYGAHMLSVWPYAI